MQATPTQLRNDLDTVVTLAHGDLAKVLQLKQEAALFDLIPDIVQTYGQAAATIGADWYDTRREELAVRKRFTALVPDLGDLGGKSLVGWAAQTATDDVTLASLLQGGVQRRVLDYGRQTVMQSSFADPSSKGWERQSAGGCSFCAMLEGRGAVYSEASADFASHDNCRCQAVPVFTGQAKPVKPYTPSERVANDTDRARVRAWLKANPQGASQ